MMLLLHSLKNIHFNMKNYYLTLCVCVCVHILNSGVAGVQGKPYSKGFEYEYLAIFSHFKLVQFIQNIFQMPLFPA